jgi:uncharacterized RDD family membrane protein YckC
MAAVSETVSAQKAGFWIRVVAYLIDLLALLVVQFAVAAALFRGDMLASSGVSALIDIVYFIALWSSYGGGQTLGMRVLNLRVIRTDGSPLSLVNAVVRYVGLVIAVIPLLIGIIWVAFDANKQGWHDKIAGTYVVRTS